MKDIIISNNKFAQEVFELPTVEQRIKIITYLNNHFLFILSNKWGNFSFQYLLKSNSIEQEQHLILNIIKEQLHDVINNKRSNYFIQRFIPNLCPSSMDLLYQFICKDNITKYIVNSLSLGFLKTFITHYHNVMNKHYLLIQLFSFDNICLMLEITTVNNFGKNTEIVKDTNNTTSNVNTNVVNNNVNQIGIIPVNILGIDFILEVISLLQKDIT